MFLGKMVYPAQNDGSPSAITEARDRMNERHFMMAGLSEKQMLKAARKQVRDAQRGDSKVQVKDLDGRPIVTRLDDCDGSAIEKARARNYARAASAYLSGGTLEGLSGMTSVHAPGLR